jgi:hypothetical protein
MMEKQARSKLFNILITIFIAVGSGYLIVKCEDIPLGWLVVFMLLWMASIFVLNYYRSKEFKVTLAQPIEGIVAELRGGKYKRKMWLWMSLFAGLGLLFNGVVASTNPRNLRVLILSLGTYILLVAVLEFLSTKNWPQIRLVLLQDKLMIFEAPNQEKTILMKDLRNCIYNEKKSYVFSFYNQKITIDSRDFEEEEFAEFKARLQSVTDYWMDKQLSNGWRT